MADSTEISGRLKLSTWDFRFLSAWVQGIDVRDAWSRYMPQRGSTDLRRIRSTTRELLDVLAGIARRRGDGPTAALLRRDPLRIKQLVAGAAGATGEGAGAGLVASATAAPVRQAPSLEAFAETLDGGADFYSEAELIALWTERYGASGQADRAGQGANAGAAGDDDQRAADRAAARRARLVQRQLTALRRLEQLVATRPQPADPVEAWLDAALCQRLRGAEVGTLDDLVDFLNRHGTRWYTRVPRVGAKGAARLVAWLQHHAETLGALGRFALVPRAKLDVQQLAPAPQAGIVPLERLTLPARLNGLEGTNRRALSRARIAAVDDYGAINAWLKVYQPQVIEGRSYGNANTWRAYRREAERFLLWAVFERGKALSSLDSIDCAAYARFLEAPSRDWVAGKGVPRWSSDWRPFEGPLAPRSLAQAVTICRMLCRWLVGQLYLDSNPWDGAPKRVARRPLVQLRSLSDKQAGLFMGWLEEQPQDLRTLRLQTLVALGLSAGLRADELASARLGWLVPDVDEEGRAGWSLRVWGKGGREREVPLLDSTAALVMSYLAARDLNVQANVEAQCLVGVDPEQPLVAHMDREEALSAGRVYEIVKDAVARCAADLEAAQPQAAAQIQKASTHWLRHTFGRMWADRGGDMRALSEVLGHSNPATTAIYSRASERLRRSEMRRVFSGQR